MELMAFNLDYTFPGGKGSVVLYAACGEDAEVAFLAIFHPSKELQAVTPLIRKSKVRPNGVFDVLNKGVEKSTQ